MPDGGPASEHLIGSPSGSNASTWYVNAALTFASTSGTELKVGGWFSLGSVTVSRNCWRAVPPKPSDAPIVTNVCPGASGTQSTSPVDDCTVIPGGPEISA